MATDYLTGIKRKIEADDIVGAERDLHHLILNKDFRKVWGRDDLPVIWGHIAHMKLDTSCPTAMVDLRDGKVFINPTFLMEKIHSIEDLLFIILHERDHRLIRRIYRVDWYRLRKILDFKDEWVAKVRNVLEDAWINASVRSSMGIKAGLPEQFYCWTQADVDNPGKPTPENPKASGFDPAEGHKLGDPKSEEFAMLTCLSPFVNTEIQTGHEGLYSDAGDLLSNHGLTPVSHRGTMRPSRRRYNYNYDYGTMLSFPEWYRVFCNWLEKHKDDLEQPSPGSEHDEGCPQHGDGNSPGEGEGEGDSPGDGNSPGEGDGDGEGEGEGSGSGSGKGKGAGKGKGGEQDSDGADKNDPEKGHGHGGNKPCTCNGGNGLLGEPMTLKERLARVPDILVSKDEMDKSLEKDAVDPGDKDPMGKDQPLETMEMDPSQPKGVSWGGKVRGHEVVPQVIEELDDFDRGLLEMGGSVLTDSHKTDTVQIKGAVKRYADELVQNIATMRVTDHKIVRPDFNIPQRPSRRDMMNLGMGHLPPMWDHNQYLEQNELIVYTDVSGSMCNWYSVALYLTKQLREFGCTSYQFSTVICEPVPGRDDNRFWGTGGTHFNAVAAHIREKGYKSVIIITDNCDNLSPEEHAFLKDEVPELYLVFLEDGQRPGDIDPLEYGWGGGGRRKRGFMGTSENITGIFDSDVERK